MNLVLHFSILFFSSFRFQQSNDQTVEILKDELNCSYNGGGDAYLLQSVAIHFNHTVCNMWCPLEWWICVNVRNAMCDQNAFFRFDNFKCVFLETRGSKNYGWTERPRIGILLSQSYRLYLRICPYSLNMSVHLWDRLDMSAHILDIICPHFRANMSALRLHSTY